MICRTLKLEVQTKNLVINRKYSSNLGVVCDVWGDLTFVLYNENNQTMRNRMDTNKLHTRKTREMHWRPLATHRYYTEVWHDNGLKRKREVQVEWIHLSQDWDQWWALMYRVMQLWVPQNVGNFFTNFFIKFFINFSRSLLHAVNWQNYTICKSLFSNYRIFYEC